MKRRIRLFGLAAGVGLVIPFAAAAGAGASTAPVAPAATGIFPVAPYAYTDTGTNLANYANSSGQKDFTIAFVLAGNGCQASWNGDNTVSSNPNNPDSVEQEINALRNAGGNVSISFGGADGTYLDQSCTSASALAQQYENVVAGTGTSQVDFDLEQGLGDSGRRTRIAQAIATMQQAESAAGHPVRVTYTLGVGTDGLPGNQRAEAQAAVDAGVNLAAVNIMTMDYGSSGTEMGTAAEQASTASEKQLESVFGVSNAWSRLGITPMIGPNDTPGETFTLADANTVRSFAASKGVGYLSFWEMGNDNSGYTGQPNWAYSHAFEGYGGAAVASTVSPAALDPSVAPGGNFNLSVWELQLPIGSAGSPTTIPPSQLKGAGGFQDSYFYTDSGDGSMTFWDPENGVTTPNSKYPRSELREMNSNGSAASWSIPGTHKLTATVKVTQVPDHVCVGQIHLSESSGSTKPLLELFYYANGNVDMAIEQTPAGGNEVHHVVGNVPVGQQWSYVISLTGGNTIGLNLNGTNHTWSLPSAFNGYPMYFKAGDYDQSAGSSSTVGARVHFYGLTIQHS